MDSSTIKKALVVIVLALLVLPFLAKLLPKPLTYERMEAGFKAAGLQVEAFQQVGTPGLEADAEAAATINGTMVNIYHYANEGKIAMQVEYQKKDPGSAIVESWGLAQSLGAAVPQNQPSKAARRGMFMIVATGPDEAMVKKIVEAFHNL